MATAYSVETALERSMQPPNRATASTAHHSRCTKYLISACLSLLSLVLTASAPTAAADEAGERLAEQVYNRPDGMNSSARATMTLIEGGSAPRVRQMFTYRSTPSAGEVWSLLRFVSPANIDGTGLLTIDRESGRSSQWVYLPALGRNRRISSSNQGGRFVGSEFFYEDLRDRPVNLDEHRALGQEEIGGVVYEKLESIPVDPDDSVYSKRISWIDSQTLIPIRVDFYQGSDEPTKRWTAEAVEQVQGYYTIIESTMTDLSTGYNTRIAVESVIYDRDLPDNLFSQRALGDPRFESRFRP